MATDTPAASPDVTQTTTAPPIADPASGGAADSPPVGAPPDKAAKQFAELARRSRELRATEESLKAARAEVDQFKALKGSKNFDEVLRVLGVDFLDLVNHFAAAGTEPTPEDLTKAAIEELRAKIDAREKAENEAREESTKAATQAALDGELSKVEAIAREQADRFELVSKVGREAYELAFDTVAELWHLGGRKPLSEAQHKQMVVDALGALESHYEETGKKFSKTPKPTTEPPALKPPARTLTNQLTGATPTPRAPAKGDRNSALDAALALLSSN